jgi:hypothetical protein
MGGLIALFAAALRRSDPLGGLERRRWFPIPPSPTAILYSHRFGAFGPGFLTTFDLPDVASLIAPRPLLIHNAVDAQHRCARPRGR